MTDLFQVTGQVRIIRHQVIVTVACPECHQLHHHTLGRRDDPAIRAVVRRGWAECWMPCRLDLPGNVYRVSFARSGPGKKRRR
jgi:hypothetical protein